MEVVVNHDNVIVRLRAMSAQPIDDRLASGHLDRAAAAAAVRADSHQRRTLVAVVCLAALGLPAAGLVLARAGDGDGDDPAGDRPVLPAVELSCAGPAPIGGSLSTGDTKAERTAALRTQSAEFDAWRATHCPAENVVTSTSPVLSGCVGPKSLVETPAEPTDSKQRAVPSAGAEQPRLDMGAGCRLPSTSTSTSTSEPAPTSTAAVLNGEASASRPEGRSDATPSSSPVVTGPSAGVAGPTDNAPTPTQATAPGASPSMPGRPDDVPGPPDQVPAAETDHGPPPGVPGPPDNVPAAAADPDTPPDAPGPPPGVPGRSEDVPANGEGGHDG
jgi:hypothetical protein